MPQFCDKNVLTRAHFCYKVVHCGIWDWCIGVLATDLYYAHGLCFAVLICGLVMVIILHVFDNTATNTHWSQLKWNNTEEYERTIIFDEWKSKRNLTKSKREDKMRKVYRQRTKVIQRTVSAVNALWVGVKWKSFNAFDKRIAIE